MSFGYAPKIYLRGGMPYTHIWWPRPPTFSQIHSYFLICHLHLPSSYFKFLFLRGVYIMFCISPGSLNDCSMVFLNDAKCSKLKNVNKQKMDDVGKACAFLGVGRPLTRPGPAARPACSGADPVSRPALAGSQAGSLGCRPGLTPGPGRFPGRRAWELRCLGGPTQGSFTSSPPCLPPPWLPSIQTQAPPPSPLFEPLPTPSPPPI